MYEYLGWTVETDNWMISRTKSYPVATERRRVDSGQCTVLIDLEEKSPGYDPAARTRTRTPGMMLGARATYSPTLEARVASEFVIAMAKPTPAVKQRLEGMFGPQGRTASAVLPRSLPGSRWLPWAVRTMIAVAVGAREIVNYLIRRRDLSRTRSPSALDGSDGLCG